MTEIIPSRMMNPLHIVFDLVFLAGLAFLLLYRKRYMTVVVGLLAGVLYFLVDWGIFYKIQGSRELFFNGAPMSEGGKALFLGWLSLSYGFTNFVWMWLWIRRDEFLKEFSLYILIGWLGVAVAATGLGASLDVITIRRTTGVFHATMGLFLFFSYGGAAAYNVLAKKEKRLPLLWFFAIGVLVQFGWEAALLLGGIRSAGYNPYDVFMTVIVNSLIETSPAVPVLFCIQRALYGHRNEKLQKAKKQKQSKEFA